MSNDTNSKTDEKKKDAQDSIMNKAKVFLAKPIKRSDVAITVAVIAVGAAGVYGFNKYQSNKELSEDSNLEDQEVA